MKVWFLFRRFFCFENVEKTPFFENANVSLRAKSDSKIFPKTPHPEPKTEPLYVVYRPRRIIAELAPRPRSKQPDDS